jgi:hypothetical protein
MLAKFFESSAGMGIFMLAIPAGSSRNLPKNDRQQGKTVYHLEANKVKSDRHKPDPGDRVMYSSSLLSAR